MATGKKSKPSYLYAIIGVSLVLFLLGTLGWLVINGRSLTREFKENVTITANFHDNVPAEEIARMDAVLRKQPFTKHSKVISKEEALKIQNEIEGEDVGAPLGFNPLFASLELNVYAEYANRGQYRQDQAVYPAKQCHARGNLSPPQCGADDG